MMMMMRMMMTTTTTTTTTTTMMIMKCLFHNIKIHNSQMLQTYDVDIEDITRWREDMNFIFEWQNNIL